MPSITDVEGIKVGHWTDDVALTGCTVVLPPRGTMASCEVRGGAPGTRGTDMLQPGTILEEAHAIVLTGGSAFGLASAGGVERYLEERGIGSEIGPVLVPSVAAAVIFDLGVGDPTRRPGERRGIRGVRRSVGRRARGEGRRGDGSDRGEAVGTDARGPRGARDVGGSGRRPRRGRPVRRQRRRARSWTRTDRCSRALGWSPVNGARTSSKWMRAGNTTIGVVATNATLSKPDARRLAEAANDAVDGAVRPAHTLYDGDAVFTLATKQVNASYVDVAALVEDAVTTAVRRAVRR